MPLLYGGLVQNIASAFDRALDQIEANYNFDLGPEFEVAICKTLRQVLPQRYGVCRGFVVDRQGSTAGDDIIIYERMRFPTARLLPEDDLSRKEKVPVEAAIAYIEAKHTLELEGQGPSSLAHAMLQASNVKALCEARPSVPLDQLADGVTMVGFDIQPPRGYPQKRNPFYAAVFSRQVRTKTGEPVLTDSVAIGRLFAQQEGALPTLPPDLIVAGPSNAVIPVWFEENGAQSVRSPFAPAPKPTLRCLSVDGLAFGVGLAHLMWALDYIHPSPMPWADILSDAVNR